MSTSSVVEVFEAIMDFHRKHAPSVVPILEPGASLAEIESLERHVGTSLPDDVRAFYSYTNGTEQSYFLHIGTILSLKSIHDRVDYLRQLREEAGVFEAHPNDPRIKPVYFSDGRIPVIVSVFGDETFIDLDPENGGTPGQIIWCDHETLRLEFRGRSLEEYFTDLYRRLEAGQFYFDEDEQGLLPNDSVDGW